MNHIIDFQGIKDEVFQQYQRKKLSSFSEKIWNYHRDRINATFEGGWDNEKFPWERAHQGWWKYPLAFASYSIPSLVLIDESKYSEAVDCLRKSILLFKDTPIWDNWVKYGHGPDPICCRNIMYKGHLNLLYGLYQLISGDTEFESQLIQLTKIIVDEIEHNGKNNNCYGIECENDQYFPVCNSQGVISLVIYDLVFGTDYYHEYGKKVADFIAEKVTDKETKMIFLKYHPSHDQAEAYLTGAANSWGLAQLRFTDPDTMQQGFENFKKLLVAIEEDGSQYLKECIYASEPAMGLEESFGLFYVLGLAKEFNDPDMWAGFMKHLSKKFGMSEVENRIRLTRATNGEEHHANSYILWGALHVTWEKIFDHDWKALIKRQRVKQQ